MTVFQKLLMRKRLMELVERYRYDVQFKSDAEEKFLAAYDKLVTNRAA